MRRRFILQMLLVLAGILVLAACSGTQTATTDPTIPVESDTTPVESDTTDPSAETTLTAPQQGEGDRTLRIAVSDDLPTIDPIFGQNTLTNMVLKNIYAQFFFYGGPDEEVVEDWALADTSVRVGRAVESWEYDDGGRVVTMNIRPGTTFPETGNEMTADDFMFFYERAFCAQASTMFNSNSYGVMSLDQVEKIDDYTIRVTLEEPSPIIENQLRAQVAVILDSEAIRPNLTDDDPCGNQWIAQNYAGHGMYRLSDWQRGERISFEANEAWAWDEPYFDRVELLVIPDASNRELLLERGEVDIALDLDERQLERLSESENAKVLEIPGRRTMRLMLNTEAEPFDDPLVRQALSYATPYDSILNDILLGKGVRLTGPVSPNSEYFQDFGLGEFAPYEYDPERAVELLNEAGFGDGISFALMTPQGDPLVDEIATFLRSEFAKVGVEMEIQPTASAVLAEAMGEGSGDAYLRGWLNDFVDEPYFHFNLWWRTNSTINWTQYSNERVDEIVSQLQFETDREAQEPLTREAYEIVVNDAPEIWLVGGLTQFAVGQDIMGWIHEPDELVIWGALRREP